VPPPCPCLAAPMPPVEHHAKFYGDRLRKTPPSVVKRKMVAKYSDVGHVKGYISETMQDTASGTNND